jgi:hypothetical protein
LQNRQLRQNPETRSAVARSPDFFAASSVINWLDVDVEPAQGFPGYHVNSLSMMNVVNMRMSRDKNAMSVVPVK